MYESSQQTPELTSDPENLVKPVGAIAVNGEVSNGVTFEQAKTELLRYTYLMQDVTSNTDMIFQLTLAFRDRITDLRSIDPNSNLAQELDVLNSSIQQEVSSVNNSSGAIDAINIQYLIDQIRVKLSTQ